MAPSGDRPFTVLLADDLSIVRRPLALIFARRGFRVIEAEDGRGAVDVLGRERVDAVLLDIAMPTLDGLGVLERLAQRLREPDAPVVVVFSGHADRATAERALGLGAKAVVQKGTHSIGGLIERVQRMLEEREEVARGAARG